MERPSFEVGLRSVRSGLKIHVWTSSAYSSYSSDTEWEITKRVSIERGKKRGKDGTPRRQPNIWRSGSLGKASEIQGATAWQCSVLAARGQEGSTMSDATDSSKQVGTEKGSLQLATWRWLVTLKGQIYWWAIQSLVGVSSRDKWNKEVEVARTNSCNEVWCKKERNGAVVRGERELWILNKWRHGLCLCGWICSLRLGKIGDARESERIAVGKRRRDVIYNWRGGLHLEAQTVLL